MEGVEEKAKRGLTDIGILLDGIHDAIEMADLAGSDAYLREIESYRKALVGLVAEIHGMTEAEIEEHLEEQHHLMNGGNHEN